MAYFPATSPPGGWNLTRYHNELFSPVPYNPLRISFYSAHPGYYSTDLSDSTMLILRMEKKEKKLTESEKTTVRITAYT